MKQTKTYKHGLFIFHRDLRLDDNKALNEALQASEQVSCLFVVSPAFCRAGDTRKHAKTYLLNVMQQLDFTLKQNASRLLVRFGYPDQQVGEFVGLHDIDALFYNKEYTPAGLRREAGYKKLASRIKIAVHDFDDALLFPPGFVLKKDGQPYTVFTPFYKKACQYTIESTRQMPTGKFTLHAVEPEFPLSQIAAVWDVEAISIDVSADLNRCLDHIQTLENYSERRDIPSDEGTSDLSVQLKFGTISIRHAWRHCYDFLGADHPILRQFYWRDFFTHIGFYFPYVFKTAFKRQYQSIHWPQSESLFRAWCEGRTGFPIVDAGMRQLRQTGKMHNRVRMVVASFLVKDLLLDWRLGEQFFIDYLLDYDHAVNNGNWQWAASTGCDAQPYFRVFNPWRQQQRFDQHCHYIKKWLPELEPLSSKQIHNWDKLCSDFPELAYPAPIVEHSEQVARVKLLFKEASERAATEQLEL